MSDRDTDTGKPDTLTPDAFSPAGAAPTSEQLAATAFEPLSQASEQRRRINITQIVLGVAGVLVAAPLFFLFTARSLTLNIDAEVEPDFSLSGLNWSFGERLLVRPGDYTLSITAEGYHPYEQTVTVSDADTQQLDIRLAPLPGTVTLTTQPAGGEIILGDLSLGSAPLVDLSLEAGIYTVEAALDRYQRWQGQIDVVGRSQSQTVDIVLLPDWANIRFSATPATVTASVDGQPTDITAAGVEVLSGQRELTLSAPGFMPVTLPLSVVAGVNQDLGTVTLTPADATLTLDSTPPGAGVTVDGTFAGLTPLVLPLSPGDRHAISLSKAGYRGTSLSLTLSRGETASRSVTLAPELGEVRFAIEPAEAEILINGQRVGTGSQSLSLPAVQQRIAVQLEGYASFETEVTPKPGLPQQISVTLLTEAAARKAAMTPTITTPLGQTMVLVDPSVETQNPFTMGASRRDPGRLSLIHISEPTRPY